MQPPPSVLARAGWLGLALGALSALSCAAERPLFTFDHEFDVKSVQLHDAKVAVVAAAGAGSLRVRTGVHQPWPGITLPAAGGSWDLSTCAAVVLQLKNVGTNSVTVYCRVDNPGADGTKHCLTESRELSLGSTNTLTVDLWHTKGSTLGGKLFGMRGYPELADEPGTLDVTNITQLVLFVNHPTEEHCFEVALIRAAGEPRRLPTAQNDVAAFFPFVTTFGQYKHEDWPGKVHSLAELRDRREQEAAELDRDAGPPGWDKYGGSSRGPQRKATGFFRTEKVEGKWWLVDPEGHQFWSHGIDCVGMLDATPIDERREWFEEFPGAQPDYQEFLAPGFALKGHYAGRHPAAFSFAGANLKRKYGENWRPVYAETVQRRLRSWGLNTIANWSDPGIFLRRRTPYTDSLGSHAAKMIEGSDGYWGRFPDVFDPSFAAALRTAMAAKTNSSANDPWCIGYFSDNEMSWGDATALALGALKSPAAQAAKREFVADLQAKYGTPIKLNAAWGTSHASWEALLENREPPDLNRSKQDLIAFATKTAETYFRTVRATIKAIAPQQLYLGCRFAWVNDQAAQAAGKYCDVVSYNLYRRRIADFQFPGGDKPLIVGEFHFGALDRGLFHTGLVPVENQADRAQAYRDYVLGALRHPQMVGTHWFQWQDEPTTGRVYDEENYQIGFVDVTDTPYPETIAASRAVGRRLYESDAR